MICESVVSSPTRVARQRRKPDWFSVAAETASPAALSTGMLSPVSAASFTALLPSSHDTVHRDALAGADDKNVAGAHLPDGHDGLLDRRGRRVAVFGASFIRLLRASVVLPFERASSILPTVMSVRIMAADSK